MPRREKTLAAGLPVPFNRIGDALSECERAAKSPSDAILALADMLAASADDLRQLAGALKGTDMSLRAEGSMAEVIGPAKVIQPLIDAGLLEGWVDEDGDPVEEKEPEDEGELPDDHVVLRGVDWPKVREKAFTNAMQYGLIGDEVLDAATETVRDLKAMWLDEGKLPRAWKDCVTDPRPRRLPLGR
jgi:hypothetical protein